MNSARFPSKLSEYYPLNAPKCGRRSLSNTITTTTATTTTTTTTINTIAPPPLPFTKYSV
ncbi:hypothetical protein E2C01_039137 [Portunus trituberculatus]|uniref:Uncharacterized protein n=1 Tax=Portunus trituberculatus TaxID=210409 RepID=A0A5B7FKD3_PORTR|nr:hypothetical protein [Portunus trituberculatus]